MMMKTGKSIAMKFNITPIEAHLSRKVKMKTKLTWMMTLSLNKVKHHGLICPFHLYQVTTWVLAAAETLYLVLEVFPYYEKTYAIAITMGVYAVLLIPLGT
jgi:hypothetical protein